MNRFKCECGNDEFEATDVNIRSLQESEIECTKCKKYMECHGL